MATTETAVGTAPAGRPGPNAFPDRADDGLFGPSSMSWKFFADTGHAEGAGEAVRRIHARVRWTDPRTGAVLIADEPAWLEWTHNSIVWGRPRRL